MGEILEDHAKEGKCVENAPEVGGREIRAQVKGLALLRSDFSSMSVEMWRK